MKYHQWIPFFMVVIAILLCIPSVLYLIRYRTVDQFDAYYTYTLQHSHNHQIGLKSGLFIILLIMLYSICYFSIVKNENKIFKNSKPIIAWIACIAFIFMLILPFLSSDIFYYIGDSWIKVKYGENPYYVSVADVETRGMKDEIIDNTGYWKNTTSVYGPLWNSISSLLVGFSFGKITVALYVFKIAALIIHLANSVLLFKITKSKKYMLLYGLNPLILIECLSNVHNDSYLIFFVLLCLYFLVRKKNLCFSLFFLAFSIGIKFSTALLLPFILIYYFQAKSLPKRILYCCMTGIASLTVVVLLYMPYYQDISIFTNMLVQGEKYSQSILLYLMENFPVLWKILARLCQPTFIIVYCFVILYLVLKKKMTLKYVLQKYNILLLFFVFLVLTNFQKWYIVWLFPTIPWQGKNMKKFILYSTVIAIIPSLHYFQLEGDYYWAGQSYSLIILFLATMMLLVDSYVSLAKQKMSFKNKRKSIELKKEK